MFFFFFLLLFCFSIYPETEFDVQWESSPTKRTIHMNWQILFHGKNKKKVNHFLFANFVNSLLGAKTFYYSYDIGRSFKK